MRKYSATILTLISAFTVSRFCLGAEFPTTRIPFLLHRDHHIVVQGSLADMHNLNLVVDTGASCTVVSERVAKKLNLKGESKKVIALGRKVQVKEVTLPSVQLGGTEFTSVRAQIGNLSWFHGLQIDALIGLDLLKRTNLGIDFRSRTLTFGEIRHGQSSMRFYGKLPFVLVRVTVQGQPLELVLDSGAGPDLILFDRQIQDRVAYQRSREKKTLRHLGGKLELRKVYLSGVEMAGNQWNELSAYVLSTPLNSLGTLDGLLGTGALGLSSIQLDFENNLLSWER